VQAHRSRSGVLGEQTVSRCFVTSGDVTTFRRLGARFLGPEVEHVEAWRWS
jgi:hypothetical protein